MVRVFFRPLEVIHQNKVKKSSFVEPGGQCASNEACGTCNDNHDANLRKRCAYLCFSLQ
jgi:hypothetical protein